MDFELLLNTTASNQSTDVCLPAKSIDRSSSPPIKQPPLIITHTSHLPLPPNPRISTLIISRRHRRWCRLPKPLRHLHPPRLQPLLLRQIRRKRASRLFVESFQLRNGILDVRRYGWMCGRGYGTEGRGVVDGSRGAVFVGCFEGGDDGLGLLWRAGGWGL